MWHVTVAGSLEELAAPCAKVLAEPVDDPMAPEWVVVPTAGVEQWLQLRLARELGASGPGFGDGIAANLRLVRPGPMRRHLLAGGVDRVGDDPWTVERLTWTILGLRVGNDDLGLPGLPAQASPLAWSRRIADRFDRYHVHRPAMVRTWQAGHDRDGAGVRLPALHRWQPRLWRAVREAIGAPSPPEQALEGFDPSSTGLPDRITCFGFSALPGGAALTELLLAMAACCEIRLYVVDPSPSVWSSTARQVAVEPDPVAARSGREAVAEAEVEHRLLRSWGAASRAAAGALAAASVGAPAAVGLEPTIVEPPTGPASTVLRALQEDLRRGRPSPARVAPPGVDASIRIHAGHTDLRQVEILRDALLHLLADDSTLTEDDIVVMCPDLERFEPLVRATFAAPGADASARDEHDGSDRAPILRHRVVHPGRATDNPVGRAIGALLHLVASPCEVVDLVAFCGLEPVRRRFGLDEGAVADLARWAEDLNVRWGIDAAHRATFGLPDDLEANTWRRAVDRLLLGVAFADVERPVLDGMLPHGVEGGGVATAGGCADIVARLASLVDDVRRDRPLPDWLDWLGEVRDAFLDFDEASARHQESVDRVLGDLRVSADGASGAGVAVTFADLRWAVDDALGTAAGSGRFFGGGVTVTSLGPARSVPYRVVCLLGLDQEALATAQPDGDDLIAVAPLPGDPDRRGEVRQALLESVLAAGDHLVVVRRGHEAASNDVTPEAVVVTELRAAIAGVLAPGARAVQLEALDVEHPLQPTDVQNFVPGQLGSGGPWSFDPVAAAGARARATSRVGPQPLPGGARDLPVDEVAEVVEMAALRRFLESPSRFYCEEGLGIRLPDSPDRRPESLPVALDGLESWSLCSRLLADELSGGRAGDDLAEERSRDRLPIGAIGDDAFAAACETAGALAGERRALVGDTGAIPQTVLVELDDGTVVVGSVEVVRTASYEGVIDVSPSKVKVIDDLRAWLDLLVLTATEPATTWTVTKVRFEKSVKVSRWQLHLDAAGAREVLGELVALMREGRRAPQPFFPRMSREVARAVAVDADDSERDAAWGAAAQRWEPTAHDHERTDRFVLHLYDGWSLQDLRALPSNDRDTAGPSLLEALAVGIWGRFAATTEAIS